MKTQKEKIEILKMTYFWKFKNTTLNIIVITKKLKFLKRIILKKWVKKHKSKGVGVVPIVMVGLIKLMFGD
jgi:hypothetical protein